MIEKNPFHVFTPVVIGQFISCLPEVAGETVYFIYLPTVTKICVKDGDVIVRTDGDQDHVVGRVHPQGDVKRLLWAILQEIETGGADESAADKENKNGKKTV